MIEIRNLTCIGCPMGCQITVELEDGQIKNITGYTCKRGLEYAKTEVLHPVRTVTGTIRLMGGTQNQVPVKTAEPIGKELVTACAKLLKQVKLTAPVHTGDVAIKNVLGTGIDVVVTKDIEQKK